MNSDAITFLAFSRLALLTKALAGVYVALCLNFYT